MAGRPSKYDTHVKPYLTQIKGWARNGLTEKQIYDNLGVNKDSFIKYKNENIELLEALKYNKELADLEIENAMFESAKGFYYQTQELTKSGEIVTIEKYQPPSNTAQIFWLKNRRPQQWRDKQEVTHEGKMDINNPFANLSTEDLKKLIDNE